MDTAGIDGQKVGSVAFWGLLGLQDFLIEVEKESLFYSDLTSTLHQILFVCFTIYSLTSYPPNPDLPVSISVESEFNPTHYPSSFLLLTPLLLLQVGRKEEGAEGLTARN